jgi:ABC-type bacteriocin/lantibiotic exporter with double-glycine peptidase domain
LPADNNQDLSTLIPFKKNIIFKDISFRYTENTPWILKDVNLTVKKGQRIGFIGVTGSGKSTLLDILMGLLPPTSGELLIDGIGITQENKRAWQKHISHVPQSIYLADNSIQENIAFGIDPSQIQKSKVAQAAQLAQISETINNFKSQYKTFIGERGVQLSGGQRQRLGIARALYKDSDVLIFDEATSALDNKTEKRVMEQISNLKGNPTIFIIAHRLTTLKECDSIIRINENHSISQISSNEIGLD